MKHLSFDVPFDEIKAAIQEHLDVEADKEKRTIKLQFKGSIYEEMPFMDMLENEESLKRMSKVFLDEEIKYSTELLSEGKGVILFFETDEDFHKMQKFITGIVSGDLLKELMERMMKLMFSAFDDDNSEFENTT